MESATETFTQPLVYDFGGYWYQQYKENRDINFKLAGYCPEIPKDLLQYKDCRNDKELFQSGFDLALMRNDKVVVNMMWHGIFLNTRYNDRKYISFTGLMRDCISQVLLHKTIEQGAWMKFLWDLIFELPYFGPSHMKDLLYECADKVQTVDAAKEIIKADKCIREKYPEYECFTYWLSYDLSARFKQVASREHVDLCENIDLREYLMSEGYLKNHNLVVKIKGI